MGELELGRIFLVGFPRSGTTLLQSLLVAHPDLISIPESFFFSRLRPIDQWRRFVRPPRPAMRAQLDAIAAYDPRLAPLRYLDGLPAIVARPLTRRFIRAMDDEAERDSCRAWLEKTPSHLYRIPLIQQHVPRARFVHMIRSGLPAIASLYAATNDHSDQWGGARTLAACASRWQADIRISSAYIGRDSHAFVSYEKLTDNPSSVLARLVGWLGLEASSAIVRKMIAEFGSKSGEIVVNEPWKAGVGSTISNRNQARVKTFLSPGARQEVSQLIACQETLLSAMPFI